MNTRKRFATLMVAGAAIGTSLGLQGLWSVARAGGGPPAMAFTPNAQVDAGHSGGNEPQVLVDQSGKAYATWQESPGSTFVATTTDGTHFSNIQNPDPNPGGPVPSALGGDVVFASTNWPSKVDTPQPDNTGSNDVTWSDLAQSTGTCSGDPEVRSARSLDGGVTWINRTTPSCQPALVDRQWEDSYTPPAFRGKPTATAHTDIYATYHDLTSSEMWLIRSFDGGATWDPTAYPAFSASTPQGADSACNTISGGIATDKNGSHPGRVYVTWSSSDLANNAGQGCNISQAEAFDHIYLSYSDNAGVNSSPITPPTFASIDVFNDPCAPNPPAPPTSPTTCQDVSELFTPVTVDDAGNPYVAYVRYNLADPTPEYDVYVARGTFDGPGGALRFTAANTHKVNPPGEGTHYQPAIIAGSAGAIEVAYYATTTFRAHPATAQKPGFVPGGNVWNVYLAQSFDFGATFTENKVSDNYNYFGDICSTGLFCGNGATFGWGDDRIVFEDFGLAIGPDGGARLDWTDSRLTRAAQGAAVCGPSVSPTDDTNVGCQSGNTNIFFACQTSGLGLHGETVTGCGQSLAPGTSTPETPLVPGLLAGALGAGLAYHGVRRLRRRRDWYAA